MHNVRVLCKRGGSSGAGSRGNSGNTSVQQQQQTTPSGVTYDQFMQMSLDERYDLINQIATDNTIQVPKHLDDSITTKVMYAIGMNNKPNVVSDSELDDMFGQNYYRTVDSASRRISAKDILDQIKTSDFTRLSATGGSLHGRALYFARDFLESASYGTKRGASVMRVKFDPFSNIITEDNLLTRMGNDQTFNRKVSVRTHDRRSLYALANGIDGWEDTNLGYLMLLNRGVMTASSTNKKAFGPQGVVYDDWESSPNV